MKNFIVIMLVLFFSYIFLWHGISYNYGDPKIKIAEPDCYILNQEYTALDLARWIVLKRFGKTHSDNQKYYKVKKAPKGFYVEGFTMGWLKQRLYLGGGGAIVMLEKAKNKNCYSVFDAGLQK